MGWIFLQARRSSPGRQLVPTLQSVERVDGFPNTSTGLFSLDFFPPRLFCPQFPLNLLFSLTLSYLTWVSSVLLIITLALLVSLQFQAQFLMPQPRLLFCTPSLSPSLSLLSLRSVTLSFLAVF